MQHGDEVENTVSSGDERISTLENLADTIRARTFETILEANNGHIGGCSSSTELMTTLYFGGYLNYDPHDSKNLNRDIVLVRGHEGPLRYTIFSMIGYIEKEELRGYRRYGTRLHGHEDMFETPGVDISPSGSLGMLLSYGTGAALESKRSQKDNNTIVFLGDGEEQEGNASEAARSAAALKLDNLIVIIDKNGKQLSRETAYSDGETALADLWKAYGWEVLEIPDGNDVKQIDEVYDLVFHSKRARPTCIIANTIKGYKLPEIEKNYSGAHTLSAYNNNPFVQDTINNIRKSVQKKGLTEENVYAIARKLSEQNIPERVVPQGKDIEVKILPPENISIIKSINFYFKSLVDIINKEPKLAPNFYFLTPDLLKRPLVEEFNLEKIGPMLDMGVREQHIMASAHGISTMDPKARLTIFMGDAFAYRYMDQLNAAGMGQCKALIFGEKAGLCQGANGASHQSIGQSMALLGIPFVDFREPADAQDLYMILNNFYTKNDKLLYVRLHNKKYGENVIAREVERTSTYYVAFEPKEEAQAIIVSSGFPLCNAVLAGKELETRNVSVRVINVIDPRSIDDSFVTLLKNDIPLLLPYNGNPETLATWVSRVVAKSPIRPSKIIPTGYNIGTTGSLEDLEKHYGLSKEAIVRSVIESI